MARENSDHTDHAEAEIRILEHQVKALEEARQIDIESHGKIYAALDQIRDDARSKEGEFTAIKDLLAEMKEDVKEVKNKPKARLEMIINLVLSACILAVMGLVFVNIGLG